MVSLLQPILRGPEDLPLTTLTSSARRFSVPLCWHIEAWNAGMCLYVMWTALGNLIYFVNSTVWSGNTTNWAPIWCDISTKFMIGLTVGLPAASLCINRRLYKIATMRKMVTTRDEKRRDIMIDLCIGVGVPVIVMALHYIAQSHRFDIFEDLGCMPVIENSWVGFLVTQAPIIVVTITSGTYLALSAIASRRREKELRILLSSTTPSPNRFLRLMCLAGISVVLTCFVVCAGIIFSVNTGFQPWSSWADVHSSFSQVVQQPATAWRSDPNTMTMLELPRWVGVVYGMLFFAFFGFAQEARKNYHSAFAAIMRYLGFRKSKNSDTKGSDFGECLPTTSVTSTEGVSRYRDNNSIRIPASVFASRIGEPSITERGSFKTPSKELPPLPGLDSIEMPVVHDFSSILRPQSSVSMDTIFSTGLSPNVSHSQISTPNEKNTLGLENVRVFSQASLRIPSNLRSSAHESMNTISSTGLSPNVSHSQISLFPNEKNMLGLEMFPRTSLRVPSSRSRSRAGSRLASAELRTSTIIFANHSPIELNRSPAITPNINTPPPHRPHSFPASVTSYTSPPPQIVVLPPPHSPFAARSSVSSESMYSMSTATDASPHGGLFPFPLLPSTPPSQTLRLHSLSASFLDLETPKASSFLDFDGPPPVPRARNLLSPGDHMY